MFRQNSPQSHQVAGRHYGVLRKLLTIIVFTGPTMASEQFSLCWDNFHKNMSSGMNALLEHEDLVDVTLAVEGRLLKAHKMVLSVCSPYFKELFKSNPCQHPIVFMKDVSYVAMSDLLQFMYQGEVQVSQDNLTTFIKTAEALQIKGLTGDGNVSTFLLLIDFIFGRSSPTHCARGKSGANGHCCQTIRFIRKNDIQNVVYRLLKSLHSLAFSKRRSNLLVF